MAAGSVGTVLGREARRLVQLAGMRRFYEKSAEIYRHVAEIDRGHHHEALYWAEREAQEARELDGA